MHRFAWNATKTDFTLAEQEERKLLLMRTKNAKKRVSAEVHTSKASNASKLSTVPAELKRHEASVRQGAYK